MSQVYSAADERYAQKRKHASREIRGYLDKIAKNDETELCKNYFAWYGEKMQYAERIG